MSSPTLLPSLNHPVQHVGRMCSCRLYGASQILNSLSPYLPHHRRTSLLLALLCYPAERPLIEPSASSDSLQETLSPPSHSVNADILTSSSSATELVDKQQELLVKEVRRRTDAAMADLNRTSSNVKINDASQ